MESKIGANNNRREIGRSGAEEAAKIILRELEQ
jgi:hypothetical protein